MHKSRLAGFIIDCQTEDLEGAARFWGAALGPAGSRPPPRPPRRSTAGSRAPDELHVEVQQVHHQSRVHLDIEADRHRGRSTPPGEPRRAAHRARAQLGGHAGSHRAALLRRARQRRGLRPRQHLERLDAEPQRHPFPAQARAAARGRARARARSWARCCASRAARQLFELVEEDRVTAIRGRERRARRRARTGGAGARPAAGAGARPGARVFRLVPGGEPRREGASHPPPPRLLPQGQPAAAARRRRGCARRAQGAGPRRCTTVLAILLGSCQIEPVFAAALRPRPARRTLLRKQQRVAQLLLERLDPTLTPHEARAVWNSVRTEITSGLADRGAPARTADGGRRARARPVLPGRGAVPGGAGVLRGDRAGAGEALRRRGRGAASCRASCTSAPGSAATWTATRTCTPRPSARPWRASNRVILNAYFEECQDAGAGALAERQPRRASPRSSPSASSTTSTLLPGARAITPARHDRMPYRVFLAQIGDAAAQCPARAAPTATSRRAHSEADIAPDHREPAGQQGLERRAIIRCERLLRRVADLRLSPGDAGRAPAHRACITRSSPRAWPIRTGSERTGAGAAASCWRRARARPGSAHGA